MPEEKSWEKQIESPLDSPDRFKDMIKWAHELVQAMPRLFGQINPDHMEKILKEYQELSGAEKTKRAAGLFAMLDEITPEMMGDTEKAWF